MSISSKTKLVQKIRAAMAQPLTEITLKSILADTRKLLELCGAKKTYLSLNFHCNWALHTKMERGLVGKLLEDFDAVWNAWVTKKQGRWVFT
jgi:hypothetical protein